MIGEILITHSVAMGAIKNRKKYLRRRDQDITAAKAKYIFERWYRHFRYGTVPIEQKWRQQKLLNEYKCLSVGVH